MNLSKRKSDFVHFGEILGEFLKSYSDENSEFITDSQALTELRRSIESNLHYNAWFTPTNILSAIEGLVHMLSKDSIDKWLEGYPEITENSASLKNVGLVMAGNIPLVGFHDLLCVLISGNQAVCKLSSSDDRIWPGILNLLSEVNPEFDSRIKVVSNLKTIDAVIATGSNNTSRYFDYYFSKYPNIIRKNRNSVALLKGSESEDELNELAKDVFAFFGLGCRNVSKLYLPREMDLNKVIKSFYPYHDIIHHNKYANNYDYNKTVMLMNLDDILENGFMIFKQSSDIASPLATLFYEYYDDYNEIKEHLNQRGEEIQCIVGDDFVPFGKAQKPELWDYADGVDTLSFLNTLN